MRTTWTHRTGRHSIGLLLLGLASMCAAPASGEPAPNGSSGPSSTPGRLRPPAKLVACPPQQVVALMPATVVEPTLRETLAWDTRSATARGFVTALDKSSRLARLPNHEWHWAPRTYPVQADVAGAPGGAQASLPTQARDAVASSLTLLDGITPLSPDANAQKSAIGRGSRLATKQHLERLLQELDRKDANPRDVGDRFTELLGATASSGASVKGDLQALREDMRLTPDQVNTIGDEQSLTNYTILTDFIVGARRSWEAKLRRHGSSTPLGPDALLFAAIGESVRETYFVMNSVSLGPIERQTLLLCPEGEAQLTFSDLLLRVDHLVNEEGPRVMRDQKSADLSKLRQDAERLRGLVAAAALIRPRDGDRFAAGYRAASVERVLTELTSGLTELVRTVDEILQTDADKKRRR